MIIDPSILIILIIPIIAVVLVFAIKLKKLGLSQPQYKLKKQLFNTSERKLYDMLKSCLPEDVTLLSMVRLADIIEPQATKSNRKAWQQAFNRIQAKHVDFIICQGVSKKVVGVLELDGKSHLAPARKARDVFLEDACSSANLTLIRIKVDSPETKSVEALQTALLPLKLQTRPL